MGTRRAGSFRENVIFRSRKVRALDETARPFQLTRHLVRDISRLLTVAPITSLMASLSKLPYYSSDFTARPARRERRLHGLDFLRIFRT